MIKVGQQIPDLEVGAFHKDDVRRVRLLSDYRGGWLVLLFYPADFTFICLTELAEAAQHHEQFVAEGAELASVSTDTVWTHKAWHESSPLVDQVRFPMLADPTGALCRAFGTYLEDEGVSLRGTFLIDPDGVLQAYELHANNIGRTIPEMLRKLNAAAFVRAHDGQVCPASWRPGGETLQPGLDLVGRL
jgi:peroxiredoxin (alkyl hydroperoxide reductase subunit C)